MINQTLRELVDIYAHEVVPLREAAEMHRNSEELSRRRIKEMEERIASGKKHNDELISRLNVEKKHAAKLKGIIESLKIELGHARSAVALDIPEANDSDAAFVPEGKGWVLNVPGKPVIWSAPGGLVMIQRIEPGELTPAQARVFAANIIAAAEYAAKGHSVD